MNGYKRVLRVQKFWASCLTLQKSCGSLTNQSAPKEWQREVSAIVLLSNTAQVLFIVRGGGGGGLGDSVITSLCRTTFPLRLDCVESMHSSQRTWACLLDVSLWSGFVLTKKVCIRNSAIKCSMVPIGCLVVDVLRMNNQHCFDFAAGAEVCVQTPVFPGRCI